MGDLTLEALPLEGAFRIVPVVRGDERGSFSRLFCARELSSLLGERSVAQANLSRTGRRASIRGLHYQLPPHCETKILGCISGRVFDVIVDLRAGSPSFLRWHGEELDGARPRLLYVPEGFAHGFQTLTDDATMLYFHTAFHAPGFEGGLRWDDPRLAIPWPLPPAELSARDRAHPLLDATFEGIRP